MGDLVSEQVRIERLTEAVGGTQSNIADAAAVLVNVGDLRYVLRALREARYYLHEDGGL